jgi:flagellar motor switch protein FliN
MAEQQTRKPDAINSTVEPEPVELPEIETPQAQPGKARAVQEGNLKMILDIPVDVRVELGHTVLPIGEILRLGQGSIVALDRLTGSPADLVVNGTRVGQGDVVVVDENFGIRITKLLKPEERIAAL